MPRSASSSRRIPVVLRFGLGILAVLGILHVVSAPAAHADPYTCRRAISGATARFAQAKMKALQKCEDGVVARRGGSCPDGKAGTKISKAGFKLRRAIGK